VQVEKECALAGMKREILRRPKETFRATSVDGDCMMDSLGDDVKGGHAEDDGGNGSPRVAAANPLGGRGAGAAGALSVDAAADASGCA
jgi:hypothetical protein